MKKTIRRLSLRSETLRHLPLLSLARAAGGSEPTTGINQINETDCICQSQPPGCTLPPTACFATCSCSG